MRKVRQSRGNKRGVTGERGREGGGGGELSKGNKKGAQAMRKDRWRQKNENAREIWDEDEGCKEERKWTR